MPKIFCRCGTPINLSIIPSPHGFKMIGENDFDHIKESLTELYAKNVTFEELSRAIHTNILGFQNKSIIEAYLCPTCSRLWLFKPTGSSKAVLLYQLEEGNPEDIHNPPEQC